MDASKLVLAMVLNTCSTVLIVVVGLSVEAKPFQGNLMYYRITE
jgi:hypothetical protein